MKERKCKRCGREIPKTYNGKRVYTSRVYCFECSPLGIKRGHNWKKTLICKDCGRSYIYTKKLTSKGYTVHLCLYCNVKKHRKKKMLKAIEYLGGKCSICGYNKCIEAYDFHHIDRRNKEADISDILCRAWRYVKKELNKCILLCSNCHRELHASDKE